MLHFTRAFGLVIFATLLGCAGNAGNPNLPPLVKVTGTVLYQGQPVAGADVTFNNSEKGFTAVGKTDEQGKFELSTSGQKGVVAGKQVVAVRRVEIIDNTPPEVDVSAGGVAPPPTVRWLVPEKYSIPSQSGLTVEVTASGEQNFPLDLK